MQARKCNRKSGFSEGIEDVDDLVQEGMIVMLRSIDSFEEGHGCTFRSFFNTNLTRHFHDMLKKRLLRKNTVHHKPTEDIFTMPTPSNIISPCDFAILKEKVFNLPTESLDKLLNLFDAQSNKRNRAKLTEVLA